MKIYYLKNKIYKKFIKDKEFCYNKYRPYYIINNLKYKNITISIAIPLRSNINKFFQKDKTNYVYTLTTNHTLINKGNVAGWHISKMVPIKKGLISASVPKTQLLIFAVKIASKYKKQEFIRKSKTVLKRLEKGEKVVGAINFDYYVNLLYKDKDK